MYSAWDNALYMTITVLVFILFSYLILFVLSSSSIVVCPLVHTLSGVGRGAGGRWYRGNERCGNPGLKVATDLSIKQMCCGNIPPLCPCFILCGLVESVVWWLDQWVLILGVCNWCDLIADAIKCKHTSPGGSLSRVITDLLFKFASEWVCI